MNVLAELLPKGLLRRTERQASAITALVAPLGSGAGPGLSNPTLAFWGTSGLVFPKCQGTRVRAHLMSAHQPPVPPSPQKASTPSAAVFIRSKPVFPRGTPV